MPKTLPWLSLSLSLLTGCSDLDQAQKMSGLGEATDSGKADDPDSPGPGDGGDSQPGDDGFDDDDDDDDGGSDEEGGSDDDDGGSDDGEDGDDGTEPDVPARYPAGSTHSPISPWVAERLVSLSEQEAHVTDVFMSVGDSITVSQGNLKCFGGSQVDLGEHEGLAETLAFFGAGEAGGTDPFSRTSQAAEVGQTAAWAVTGSPSPVQAEISAIDPAVALVQYGTNDMQQGATFGSAMPGFYIAMSVLLDGIVDRGIVPVVFTIPPRLDSSIADGWVPAYNAVIRGLAQHRQIPLVDLHGRLDALSGDGLVNDGLHLNAHPDGACLLTNDGLEFGNNNRNLVALQALDRVRRTLEGEVLDGPSEPPQGTGTSDDPWVITELPFVDTRDTEVDGESVVDGYSCSSANESGPEIWYRLEIEQSTEIRAIVLDMDGVDIDVHLAEATDGSDCLARDDRSFDIQLAPGTYHLSLDTFVSGSGTAQSGEFTLAVIEI